MLRWRLVLGALFIALLVGLCWLDYHAARPGVFLLPLATVLSLAGAGELLTMFRKRGHTPLPWVVYSGALITVLLAGASVYIPAEWSSSASVGRLGWLAVGLAASFAIAVVAELRRYPALGRATSDLGVSCLAILYIGGLMGFMVQLRLLSGGAWGNDGRWGMLAIASLIVTVKMSDTGQYWMGRMFGRHKLAPAVSPGKTWEGAVGGVLFAVGTAWLVFAFSRRSASGIDDVIPITSFAIAVAIAGIVGDLAESMLKRDAGVKDSSTWMPGFGGVLDLLDSLLGAAPVAYIFWALRIVGP
ncbi:MAG TPA: CDP-archaeol synthase [Lacipirellulaceae bacterium]|nr:CDP-archaeol synthase [Lacipirellulaceae bacterium]